MTISEPLVIPITAVVTVADEFGYSHTARCNAFNQEVRRALFADGYDSEMVELVMRPLKRQAGSILIQKAAHQLSAPLGNRRVEYVLEDIAERVVGVVEDAQPSPVVVLADIEQAADDAALDALMSGAFAEVA